jgi:hypothetical protein
MQNNKRWPEEESPTVAPKFDMEAFARDSERRIAQDMVRTAPAGTAATASGVPGSVTVPKAPRTGVHLDPHPELASTSVPVIIARERAKELVSLPTESFLLAFVDGARDVDAIVRASGLPRDLVLVTVTELVRAGVLGVRRRSRF